MAQDAYYQFQSYNWDTDSQWNEYKAKLEVPSDNPNFLVLKQQKWFKNNVNADYDPRYHPTTSSTGSNSSDQDASPKNPESASAASTPKATPRFPLHRALLLMTNLLALVHGLLALINLFTPFLLGETHFSFVFLHSGLSYTMLLLQTVGLPKFSQDYLRALVNSENLQYVMYCILFGVAAGRTIAMFPILIYCAINVGILLPRCFASLGMPLGPVASYSSLLKENKTRLLLLASNIEVAILASFILDIVGGNLGMALPGICYWNFLTTRWKQSSWTKMTVSGLEAMSDSYLLSPRCPSIISNGYLAFKGLISRLATPRPSARH